MNFHLFIYVISLISFAVFIFTNLIAILLFPCFHTNVN